jgi:signal transduction histidine kinase
MTDQDPQATDAAPPHGEATSGRFVRGLLGVAQGFALALLGIPVALALFIWTAIAVPFTLLGVGAYLAPPGILATRAFANLHRRLCRDWFGRPVAVPYKPMPKFSWTPAGAFSRIGHLLGDPATYRDLVWLVWMASGGFFLSLIALGFVAQGIYGWVLACGVWKPIYDNNGGEWYGFIHITTWEEAYAAGVLGTVFVIIGISISRGVLHGHAIVDRALLRPTKEAALQRRVEALTVTRTDAVDTSAAELRRIERDLHDGAQARLVAMGMSLGAAEHLMDSDPERAKVLIAEARTASVTALNELRDLVRGILPPVLAERGLGDAVRALALACPVQTDVTVNLPKRLADPVESAAYFAVSETLTNAVKHAQATRIWVDVRHDGLLLRLTIGDDGRGGADPTRGSGLTGISRRLATFDGKVTVSSPPGGPTLITMEIPAAPQ